MSHEPIRKQVMLNAPLETVWNAIADSARFGSWFGMKLNGPFVAGAVMRGHIVPTTVDSEVAAMQQPHEGKPVELVMDRIEPRQLFSFRWRPFAIDPEVDYSKEPRTLVTFTLAEKPGGVLLTLTESGFEGIPASRRAEAFRANDGGWAKQMELIQKYLAKTHASR